jgi:hypothetical protein
MEFSVLLAVILSALLIMQFYIKRAYQGKVREEADQIGRQYSPGHTNITSEINITTNTTTATGGTITLRGGGNPVPVPDGMTVTVSNTTETRTKNEVVAAFKEEE